MHNKVKDFINDKKLFSIKQDKIILAISGGTDSVCLMHILLHLGVNIHLAHCNFNLRDKESKKDEEFVRSLSNTYSLKLHFKSFKTTDYASKNNISIQMAARDLRYNWFAFLLENEKADYIATAHHKDDSIETFFINLIRGSGILGLRGIPCEKERIVRPLLNCSRIEIENYLLYYDLKYMNDSSNSSSKYLRNNIRNKLIPLLQDFNPSINETIFSEMNILRDTFVVFDKHMKSVKEDLIDVKEGLVLIDIDKLSKLEPLNIYLFELLKGYGFNQIESILLALDGQSGKRFYSRSHELLLDRETIFIREIRNEDFLEVEILELDNKISFPINLKFSIYLENRFIKHENIAQLDFSKLEFPLKLRKWKDGDRFVPLGMNTFKKLSDFFIDNKFSLIEKQEQWLLCSGDDIVWVIGHRIDERYKVNSKTKKLYIAEIL